jgi:ubiquinone/menaquinone biosynthesis C-methylase UbiE
MRSGLCFRLIAFAIVAAVCAAAPCLAAESRESWQQPERVVADLGLKAGASVADVGAGRGYFTFRLAAAVGENGKVYATDIDAKALQAVKDQAAKQNARNVETIVSEPTDTKLAPASVDTAILCDVLHHVDAAQRDALVKNIAGAIRPGGYLFIIDWRDKPEVPFDRGRHIPQESLVKLATDAGLVLEAEFHYLKYQVFLRFRKPPQP